MPVWAQYRLSVNWSGTFQDITADVIRFWWEGGRDNPSQLEGRANAGVSEWTLDNSSGKYSTFNNGSPLWGLIKANKYVKIEMKIGGGSWFTMFMGYLESVMPEASRNRQEAIATLRAHGVLGWLAEQKCTVDMWTNIHSGTCIIKIADSVSLPAGQRSFDSGLSEIGRWWESSETDALSAMRRVEETECGFLHEGKSGQVVYEDRSHRLNPTAAATYTNALNGAIRYSRIKQLNTASGVKNKITARVRTFDVTEQVVLWSKPGDPIAIANGQTYEMRAVFPSPTGDNGYLAVDSWDIINIYLNDQPDGLGNDVASQCTIVTTKRADLLEISIANNSGGIAYITEASALGSAVVESDTIEIFSSVAPADKEYNFPGAFIEDAAEAKEFCDHLVTVFSNEIPAVEVEFDANVNSSHLAEAQAIDISRCVHLDADADTCLYLDGDFFIEKYRHEVILRVQQGDGPPHHVTLTLSSVAGAAWNASTSSRIPDVITPPGTVSKTPDDLWCTAWYDPAGSGHIYAKCAAWKFNHGVTKAELRAKWFPSSQVGNVDLRTVAEGGTFVGGSATEILFDDLNADEVNGCIIRWPSGATTGKWYYAFRLWNDLLGRWSVWTDGNETPINVPDMVDMAVEPSVDSGPPGDWNVWLTPGKNAGEWIPHASRPKVNGKRIKRILFQIRQVTSASDPDPTFEQLNDNGVACASVYYDGSGADHWYNAKTGEVRRADSSGGGWGTGKVGDLFLIDIRADSQFDIDHCEGEIIQTISDTNFTPYSKRIFPKPDADTGEGTDEPVWHHCRILIVNAWWNWGEPTPVNGYFGSVGKGYIDGVYENKEGGADFDSQEFVGKPMIPAGNPAGTSLAVRAAFLNDYSVSDNRIWTVGAGGTNDNRVAIWKKGVVTSEEGFQHRGEYTFGVGERVVSIFHPQDGPLSNGIRRDYSQLFLQEWVLPDNIGVEWDGCLTINKTNESETGEYTGILWDWTGISMYLSTYYDAGCDAQTEVGIDMIIEGGPGITCGYYQYGISISNEWYENNGGWCNELICYRGQAVYDEHDHHTDCWKSVWVFEAITTVMPIPYSGGESNAVGGGMVIRPWYKANYYADKALLAVYGLYIDDQTNTADDSDGGNVGCNFFSHGDNSFNVMMGHLGIGNAFAPTTQWRKAKRPTPALHVSSDINDRLPVKIEVPAGYSNEFVFEIYKGGNMIMGVRANGTIYQA